MAAYEVAHLTEQLDAESPTPVAPRRRGRWLVAGVGLALAIAGCMGVAVGMARARKPASPVEHLSTIRKKLMKAFSSRALLEDTDLAATANFVWNEEGAEDPSAMGVKVAFKQGTEKQDGMKFKIIWLAQEGRGDDLVAKLQGILSALVEFARSEGLEWADELEKAAQISAGEGDEAVLEVTPPSGDEEDENIKNVEDEIQKDITENTEFEASLYMGRTIAEMYEHKHTSVALLPKGIKGSIHTKVASTLFDIPDVMGVGVDSGTVKMATDVFKNLARYNMRQELFYKSTDKLNGAFDEYLPSMGEAIHKMAQAIFASMPSKIRESLAGIEDVADGVKSIEVLGLTNDWEVEAIFTNFHVAPLIGDCLKEFPSEEPESESTSPSSLWKRTHH